MCKQFLKGDKDQRMDRKVGKIYKLTIHKQEMKISYNDMLNFIENLNDVRIHISPAWKQYRSIAICLLFEWLWVTAHCSKLLTEIYMGINATESNLNRYSMFQINFTFALEKYKMCMPVFS